MRAKLRVRAFAACCNCVGLARQMLSRVRVFPRRQCVFRSRLTSLARRVLTARLPTTPPNGFRAGAPPPLTRTQLVCRWQSPVQGTRRRVGSNAMLGGVQDLLIQFADPVAWHCAIHGTVTRCPLKWMACDDPTPALPPGRTRWSLARPHKEGGEDNGNSDNESGSLRRGVP